MGPLIRSLSMLLLALSLLGMSFTGSAQNPGNWSSARALDAILQDYAYRAFVRPRVRTGVPYDGTAPSNLTGIKIAAMRLVRGSLKSRGVSRYKEFEIPKGVGERPYVKRLVLVYQNLGNWSEVYYPLSGFTYLAPVLALLAYNATNLSATNLPELNIMAMRDPIMVDFSSMSQAPSGSTPKCVWFNLQGSVNFSNVSTGNKCSTTQQGHFSVVFESVKGKGKSKKVWIIVGSVVGGLLLLILLAILGLCSKKQREKRKISRMEREADAGEALSMTSIRDARTPVALGTRTQPMLEHNYVP
ncbi:uncharacterized protein LOC116200853 [Punica granatum]|uniref:Uncharacterized protein n=2 Tax=Punica granatum TaxID=22663 RepID=A0A218X9H6_PUNGR|nr:uncharacterized protein LOC116200853 [Punica granatum]OWM81593.1 hypothetical protein CDL15_Pgr007631 [Punica granatum]PKI40994.1 hypothetical protein CRG98_038522 [Punica granatum]